MNLHLELNSKKQIKQRESQQLEFKEAFSLGDALLEYARSLVGMANNQGGILVFGVKDKPHIPVGLKDNRFNSLDPAVLNRVFLEYFASDINWESEVVEIFGVTLGIIKVTEAKVKPVICTRTHSAKKLREGAIYYRYRGETREVRHTELAEMLNAEREKEKLLWIKHIQSIAEIGPRSVQIFDSVTGQLDIGSTKVLLDRKLLGQLKIIQEGRFSEKDGAPALKVVGEITGLINHDTVIYNDTAYPYTLTMLKEKLGLKSRYVCEAMVAHFKIKGQPEFHASIQTGKKSRAEKYSELALGFLREEVRKDERCVEKSLSSYKKSKGRR
jgi:hypothetical protein